MIILVQVESKICEINPFLSIIIKKFVYQMFKIMVLKAPLEPTSDVKKVRLEGREFHEKGLQYENAGSFLKKYHK